MLDRIVELHPDANAGFAPQIAIQTIQEAIGALEGDGKFGATLFGLAYTAVDPNKVAQMLSLLRSALEAWRQWEADRAP